jgi:hypothetical protein
MSLKYIRPTHKKTISTGKNQSKSLYWKREDAQQQELDRLTKERQVLESARHAADAPIDKLLKDKADRTSRQIGILQNQLKSQDQ